MTTPNDWWKDRYASKIVSVQEAISRIPKGRRIFIGSGAAVPKLLAEGLVLHGEHLADNEIVHILTLGPAPYVQAGQEARFRHTAFFIGANVREAVQEGRADFMPVFLSEIPKLIMSRKVRVDVALIQVSPPDAHGYVSLGVSVDVVRAAVDSADLILAEVNPNMPRTLGDSFLPASEIDAMVCADYELPEREVEPLDDIDRAIGRHVSTLVPNGATLQLGIGKIPDAVLSELKSHQELGIHSEMISDGVMELYRLGVITGKQKTLLAGKIVTSFMMGSRGLYAWAHDNPVVEMRPSNFTNDPMNIARLHNMISINSALAVDLTGQVAADTLMGRFFSGIGGQVDFIRGAAKSPGGKPIIALRSTAKDGQVSRIRPAFEEGAGVVTSRGDVHYVVTEHGVADLWGKNIRQRALSLIEIAHPDHRAELLSAAKRRRFVFQDQVMPRARLPWEEASVETLATGEQVRVRPVRISDEEALQDMFYRLSDESRYRRFMAFRREHPHKEMQELVDLDYDRNVALVVCTNDELADIIAMARYDVDPADQLADIAFVVRDEWQRKGIGTLLMQRMADIARDRGLAGFKADVLRDNRLMMWVFEKCGLKTEFSLDAGVYHVVLRFPEGARTGPKSAAGERISLLGEVPKGC